MSVYLQLIIAFRSPKIFQNSLKWTAVDKVEEMFKYPQLTSLCKETNFCKHQVFSMTTMYQSVFLSRMTSHCES